MVHTILSLGLSYAALHLFVMASAAAAAAVAIVPKNAVITGANRGIGMELCRQLLALGDNGSHADSHNNDSRSANNIRDNVYSTIYAVCRKSSSGLASLAEAYPARLRIVEGIDVTDDEAPAKLRRVLPPEAVPVHLLVHNAGAYGPPQTYATPSDMYRSQAVEDVTPAQMRYALELNTVGVLAITQALLPNLRSAAAAAASSPPFFSSSSSPSSKLVIISSAMGSIADNGSGGHYAYRAAKAAANMVGRTLSVDLRDDGIAVAMIHPGFVHTDFGGEGQPARPGQRPVRDGARGVLDAIGCLTLETTGSFLHGNYGEGVKPVPW